MTPTRRGFLASAAGLVFAAGRASAHSPRTGCVRLPCGRRLAYVEHGNPSGSRVVFYQHGLPSSRREAEVLAVALCGQPDVRLLAFDRPGIGDSDPVACPSFNGWARDQLACADALGVRQFALSGTSGGAPYAFAIALAAPDRVTRISLACPVAEHQHGRDNGADAWFLRLSGRAPRVAGSLLGAVAHRVKNKPDVVKRILPLTPAEKTMLDDPANVALVSGFMLDAIKQGPGGPVAEGALLPGPWGLPLCKVGVPTTLFHGTADRIAPSWMSEHLGRVIPGAAVRLYPGEGHLSLPKRYAADILAAAGG